MVGVIGRSGAGKSTLLQDDQPACQIPTSGSIRISATSRSRLAQGCEALRNVGRRDCAMIFQQFNLVPRLDVLTNVLLGRLNHRPTALSIGHDILFSREERIMAIAALERLGIEQTACCSRPARLVRRPAAARGDRPRPDAGAPSVVLADEPIASLDPLNAKIVMDALRRHQSNATASPSITNLHTLDTARNYCSAHHRHGAGPRRVRRSRRTELTAETVQPKSTAPRMISTSA